MSEAYERLKADASISVEDLMDAMTFYFSENGRDLDALIKILEGANVDWKTSPKACTPSPDQDPSLN